MMETPWSSMDNRTKPQWVQEVAVAVAKMMQGWGEVQFIAESAWIKGYDRCSISTTQPIAHSTVLLTMGTKRPIDLCRKRLSNKMAQAAMPLVWLFYVRALTVAKNILEHSQKVAKASKEFIKESKRLSRIV